MTGLSRSFMIMAIFSALGGIVWGIVMAASQNHLLSPAHGHLNLLGWVSCALFAFYYHLMPRAAVTGLAKTHFALTLIALLILVPGIALAILELNETLAKIGSLVFLASMLVFAWVVIKPHPAQHDTATRKNAPA